MKKLFAFCLAILLASAGAFVAAPGAPSNSAHSITGRQGGTVTLPAGNIYLTSPITYYGMLNVTVQGHPDGTCINYIGGPTESVIDIRGANTCTFANFMVRVCKPDVYSAIMVSSLEHQGSHGGGCTACTFSNIVVNYDGGTKNTEVGFSVGPKTLYQADANNDWHRFRDCRVLGYNFAAYRVNGSQCHSLLFEQCHALNYQGSGRFGFAFEFGLFAKLYRCGGYGHNEAFIGIAGNATQLVVDHCNTEYDGAIFHPFGSGAASFPVSFRDCRFALRQREGDAAKPAINFRYAGPLVISDTLIDEQGKSVPEIVMNNQFGVVRLERASFITRVDPSGKAVVRPWGPDVDAKADASTITWVREAPLDWKFFKIPSDPGNPIN